MAITKAKGTVLGLSDNASPLVYAPIAQVRSIAGPTVKPNIVDITTHDTVGNWRKKLAVLIDPGNISFEINFDSATSSHAFATGLWNQMVNLTESGLEMVFPNNVGTLKFLAYVSQHDFNVPVDNVLSVKIQMDITEAVQTSTP